MALSDKINELLKARQVIKQKLKQNQVEEQVSEDQLSRFTNPFVEKISAPIVKKLEEIKIPTILPPEPLPAIEYTPVRKVAKRQKKNIILNIDKNIDPAFVTHYSLTLPSAILSMPHNEETVNLVDEMIAKANGHLRSLGGRIKSAKDDETIRLGKLIEQFRTYKEAL